MIKAKKPANYCAQANLTLTSNLLIRVLCSACDMVLPLEEDAVLKVNLGRSGGNVLTVSVPPFCPRCLKQKEAEEMGDPEICETNGL